MDANELDFVVLCDELGKEFKTKMVYTVACVAFSKVEKLVSFYLRHYFIWKNWIAKQLS